MPIALKKLPDARRDIAEAMRWYEDKQPGLGDRFLDEIERASQLLRDHPFQFAKRFGEARRFNLSKFPYAIWFEATADAVIVFAVLHHSRDPQLARRRYSQ